MKKMYNVLFPVFVLIWFPPVIFIIAPLNLLIDGLVTYFGMKHLAIPDWKEKLKKCLWKSWLFGFLADFIGSLILFGISIICDKIPSDSFYSLVSEIATNPFSSLGAFATVVAAIVVAGIAIYWLNRKFAFKKLEITDLEKHKLSLYLAIFTSPYIMLIPSIWLYPRVY